MANLCIRRYYEQKYLKKIETVKKVDEKWNKKFGHKVFVCLQSMSTKTHKIINAIPQRNHTQSDTEAPYF